MDAKIFYLNELETEGTEVKKIPLAITRAGFACKGEHVNAVVASGRPDYSLFFVTSGVLPFRFGAKQPIELGRGNLIVLSPGTPFRHGGNFDDSVCFYFMNFSGSYARKLLENCGVSCNEILHGTACIEQLIEIMYGLFSEFTTRDSCFEDVCGARLTLACALIGRAAIGNDVGSFARNEKLYVSLKYINENYNSEISVARLAEMEHFTVNYYRSLFIKCTGQTPVEYITAIRIDRAKKLLLGTKLQISDVADAVGYKDQIYFSRVFKKTVGISPTEYRLSASLNKN